MDFHSKHTAEDLIGALCAKCRSINIEDFVTGSKSYINPNLEGAMNGCPFCRLILPEWETGLRALLMRPIIRKANGRDEGVVEGFSRTHAGRQLVFAAEDGNPASTVISRRPPLNSFDSESAFEMALQWIKNCINEHPKCPRQVPTALPTRLVDVGSDRQEPSLYISPAGARGVYAALSYCWGPGKQPIMLTRSRIESGSYEYSLTKLPPTLRDVILICRRLGFQHIWIDALCIVQDSINAEDWKREAANMANIYGNAALTIAASAATSTSDSILSTAIPPTDLTCALPYKIPNGEMGAVYVIPYNINRSFLLSNDAKEPLELRGWTLQEKLLSPRVLKFESKQMSWDCLSQSINSNGPLPNLTTLGEPSRGARTRTDWQSIVEDFTGRSLTFNSDKLPALSGYAQSVHSKTADTYIAGLWRKDLLAHLLWWVDSRTSLASSRAKVYRAPSWSWASLDCKVYFMRPNEETDPTYDLTVLEVSVPTFAIDPFGQVDDSQRGYLKLRGPLLNREKGTAFYRFTTDEDGNRYVSVSHSEASHPGDKIVYHDDSRLQATYANTDASDSERADSMGSIYPDEWDAVDRNAEEKGPLSILMITEHYGLLLLPVWCDAVGNAFQRIGLFEIRGKEEREFFDVNSTFTTVVIL